MCIIWCTGKSCITDVNNKSYRDFLCVLLTHFWYTGQNTGNFSDKWNITRANIDSQQQQKAGKSVFKIPKGRPEGRH